MANEDVLAGEQYDTFEEVKEVAGQKRVRTRRVIISPERALRLLERNTRNRRVSPREVAKLSRIMLAGQWVYNGEAIKISEDGTILDGQHRLMAAAAAGVPFETLVIENLPNEVFSTLDQGRRRSGSDVLYIKGVKRHATVSQACSSIYQILKNKPIYGAVERVPSYGIEDIFERHPGIEVAVEMVANLLSQPQADASVVSASQLAAFYYVMDEVLEQREKATTFIEGLAVGAGLDENDPLLRFRNKVSDLNKRNAQMGGQDKTALLVKVAGMHLADEKIAKNLVQPGTKETYFTLIPNLEDAVKHLDSRKALADLNY